MAVGAGNSGLYSFATNSSVPDPLKLTKALWTYFPLLALIILNLTEFLIVAILITVLIVFIVN